MWGFQVTAKCLLPLVETTLSAKPPSYVSVLELDSRIRQTVVPPKADNDPLDDRTAISMRTFVRSHYQHLREFFSGQSFSVIDHMTSTTVSPSWIFHAGDVRVPVEPSSKSSPQIRRYCVPECLCSSGRYAWTVSKKAALGLSYMENMDVRLFCCSMFLSSLG